MAPPAARPASSPASRPLGRARSQDLLRSSLLSGRSPDRGRENPKAWRDYRMVPLRRWFRRVRAAQPARRRSDVRPAVEGLETRVVLYSASGNAWPAPQLITISFLPDGTNFAGKSSNLIASMNKMFPTINWQNIILKAAQTWAAQTNINFALVPDDGVPEGSGSYQQGDPGQGDIRIGGLNFGTSPLAQAFMPPPVNHYPVAGD